MYNPISRVHRSKEEARAAYNRLSRWYDALAGSSEKKYRDVGIQKLNPQLGESILEIGFGTGHCLVSLAQAVGPAGKVSGIDISDSMLAIAEERLVKASVAAPVDLRVGDAAALPFARHTFDAIFMSFTLELFDTPEIPLVLGQCQSVLRANGRIAIVSMAKKAGTAVRIYEWFHEKWPAAIDCRPIYPQVHLTEAGFEVCDVTSMSMWGLPVEIVLAKTGS